MLHRHIIGGILLCNNLGKWSTTSNQDEGMPLQEHCNRDGRYIAIFTKVSRLMTNLPPRWELPFMSRPLCDCLTCLKVCDSLTLFIKFVGHVGTPSIPHEVCPGVPLPAYRQLVKGEQQASKEHSCDVVDRQ